MIRPDQKTGDGGANVGGDNTGTINVFNESQYEAQLRERLDRITDELLAEKDETKGLLAAKAEIEGRLANIGPAFEAAKARIAELEQLLEREGNHLGAERLERAEKALAAGDFDEADALLAEISAEEDLAVQRKARAEFGRGQIAEEQVRWHDAATHYGEAARLNPTAENCAEADMFAWRAGKYEEALHWSAKRASLVRESSGEKSAEYAKALNDHAENLRAQGRYDEAAPLYREAIKIDKATIGEAHPDYAIDLNNLALLLRDTGRYAEAEPLFREAIEIGKATIGEEHPDYATRLNNLAALLQDMGKYTEAEPLFREAIEIGKATIGEGHPDYAIRLNNLAELLREMGRYTEAEPLYREAMKITKATLGVAHPAYAIRLNNLASLLQDMGKAEEARPMHAQKHEIEKSALGLDHPQTKKGAANYARLLREHFPDDPALTELQATFGDDIGKA